MTSFTALLKIDLIFSWLERAGGPQTRGSASVAPRQEGEEETCRKERQEAVVDDADTDNDAPVGDDDHNDQQQRLERQPAIVNADAGHILQQPNRRRQEAQVVDAVDQKDVSGEQRHAEEVDVAASSDSYA